MFAFCMEKLDVLKVLAHSFFEKLLSVSNVEFASSFAGNFVNHDTFPAVITVATLFFAPRSAVAFQGLKIKGNHAFGEFSGEIGLE
jgi:hypothetical protein